MHDRTHNGVPFRILNVMDEYTRECLTVKVARRLTHKDVLDVLLDLFLERGVLVLIRSDNGSEFIAKKVRRFIVPLVCPTFVYRTWQSVGEWLHRILQWQDER